MVLVTKVSSVGFVHVLPKLIFRVARKYTPLILATEWKQKFSSDVIARHYLSRARKKP